MSCWYINFIGFRALLKHLGLGPRNESHSSKSWAPELYHCFCLVLFYQGSQTPPLSYYLTFTGEQRCLNSRNETHFSLDTAFTCVFSHVCGGRGSSNHTSDCVLDRYRTQYHETKSPNSGGYRFGILIWSF